jgi:hypothetical protein
MSAYVVSDQVINGIVSYYKNIGRTARSRYDFAPLAEMGYDVVADAELVAYDLFEMNCEAVDSRYGQGEWKEFHPDAFQFKRVLPPQSVQAYELIRELIYQCSEGNVVESELYQALKELHNRLAHRIVKSQILS